MTRNLLFVVLALVAYGSMVHLVSIALKPKRLPNPDWFWTGGQWVRSEQETGLLHGTYTEFNPEPTDQQESKPTSEAG